MTITRTVQGPKWFSTPHIHFLWSLSLNFARIKIINSYWKSTLPIKSLKGTKWFLMPRKKKSLSNVLTEAVIKTLKEAISNLCKSHLNKSDNSLSYGQATCKCIFGNFYQHEGSSFPFFFFFLLTVNNVALVAVESSGRGFLPVKVFFKCFLTSLLNTQWKKKMNSPWIISEKGRTNLNVSILPNCRYK